MMTFWYVINQIFSVLVIYKKLFYITYKILIASVKVFLSLSFIHYELTEIIKKKKCRPMTLRSYKCFVSLWNSKNEDMAIK